MNKIRKKLLILFFGVVMIVTCIPVTAFAAEVQELPESLEPADMAFPKSSDYEGTKYYGATVSKLGDETRFVISCWEFSRQIFSLTRARSCYI